MVTMLLLKHEIILDSYGGAFQDYVHQNVTPHTVNSFSGMCEEWGVMIT
jgi:hypothetical protein